MTEGSQKAETKEEMEETEAAKDRKENYDGWQNEGRNMCVINA